MNKYYQKSDGVIWLIDAQNIVSKEGFIKVPTK